MKAILIVQEGTVQEIADLALALQGQQLSFSPDEVESIAERVCECRTKGMELKKDYQM